MKMTKAQKKVGKVMGEYKSGTLHSGKGGNIAAKRERIAAGSKEKMRKPGTPGAPTAKAFKQAAKTAKKK